MASGVEILLRLVMSFSLLWCCCMVILALVGLHPKTLFHSCLPQQWILPYECVISRKGILGACIYCQWTLFFTHPFSLSLNCGMSTDVLLYAYPYCTTLVNRISRLERAGILFFQVGKVVPSTNSELLRWELIYQFITASIASAFRSVMIWFVGPSCSFSQHKHCPIRWNMPSAIFVFKSGVLQILAGFYIYCVESWMKHRQLFFFPKSSLLILQRPWLRQCDHMNENHLTNCLR